MSSPILRRMLPKVLLMFLGATTVAGRAQTVATGCPSAQTGGNEVLTELRKLRTEILEYRIESHQENLARLEVLLSDVRSERLRLQEEERARVQQITETETYLTAQVQALSPEQRTQFEAMKAGMMGAHPEKLRAQHAALEKREAEVEERLRRAQQEFQQLRAKWNALVAR